MRHAPALAKTHHTQEQFAESSSLEVININISMVLRLFLVLLSITPLVCPSTIETFKSPADKSVLEVERGTHLEVSIGMREHNITSDENLYRLFLKYKSINLPPDVENNFDHLFSFHTGTCYSGGERSRCNELEVTLHGHPDLDGQNISLVVYRLVMPWGLPNMVRGLEAQQFMVRIVDPTPPPTTSTTPSPSPTGTPPPTCPPSVLKPEAQSQIAISRTGGNALLGVFLGAAFLTSFMGNLVFMCLWYKARTRTCEKCTPKEYVPMSMVKDENNSPDPEKASV